MRAENAAGRYRETPAYARGVARARAVMAGDADPFAGTELLNPRNCPIEETAPALLGVVSCALATERKWRSIRPRGLAALDWRTGHYVDEHGVELMLDERASVAQLLDQLPLHAERVLLTGDRPHDDDIDGFRSWVSEPVDGWEPRHYLERTTRPVMEWRRTGRHVELLRAASWFGETDAGPVEVLDALLRTRDLIAGAWPGATLLRSPATTGRELFVRSIPKGERWPVLPDELQQLVRSTSTQGRIELLWQGGAELPGLVEYDARVFYAALCAELPCGEPERWRGEHPYGEYARARVLARWTVPADWQHVGILPVLTGHGWTWPDTPGSSHEGWIAGVELQLARRWGWTVEVVESLVWPAKGRPLDAWARKLADLAQTAEHEGRRLVRAAVRAIVLHAIGAFQGREHVVTRSADVDQLDTLPAGATAPRWEGDSIVWGESTGQAWPEAVHPEWCAEVWARARVRLLDSPAPGNTRVGALHVPRAQLVGLYTDAVFLTTDPAWPDDGKVGRFRREMAHEGTLRAPRSIGDLPAVRDEAVSQ